MKVAGRRAVFLDRDGVLSVEGGEYVTCPEKLRLLPGVGQAVARLNGAGYPVFVYTNQAGVGRGYMTLEALDAVHVRMRQEIEAAGGKIEAVYACPHAPDSGCACRKPLPGMLLQAAQEHAIDLSQSYAVGDSPRDIAAGKAAGCHTVLVLSGHTTTYSRDTFPAPQPDLIFADLVQATDWLTHPVQQNTEQKGERDAEQDAQEETPIGAYETMAVR